MYSIYFIVQQIPNKRGPPAVKIGHSKDPAKRLLNLQTASPYPLRLARTVEFETKREAVLAERCLHNLGRLKYRSLGGEWFIIYGNWDKFIETGLKMAKGCMPLCKKTKHNPSITENKAEERAAEELDLKLVAQMSSMGVL